MSGVWVVSEDRCGSSVTMAALATGLEPFIAETPPWWPAEGNPRGYYAHAPARWRPVEVFGSVDLTGYCAKAHHTMVGRLFTAGIMPDVAVVLRRPLEEINASLARHFPHRAPVQSLDDLDAAVRLLRDPIEVHFHDLIDNPIAEFESIARRVAGLDPRVMATCVDRALRHFDSRIGAGR